MVYFSKPPLEGKALEHCLAGGRGFSIRMKDEKANKWVVVGDARARAAMKEMRTRAKTLKEEMAAAGLSVLGADRPVRVEGEVNLSVDVRASVKAKGSEGLLELKWTRQRLA
eukprot:9353770-Karenia_brevis.AAC.1